MKQFVLFVLLLLGTIGSVLGQRITSSCIAPDSIVQRYQNDADQLALRKIYRQQLLDQDSITIPKSLSDTVLNALLALYNVKQIRERDTVLDHYNLHAQSLVGMNVIYFKTDTTIHWTHNLRQNIRPVQEPVLDELLTTYGMQVDGEFVYPGSSSIYLSLKTATNLNVHPLVNRFKSLDVDYACVNNQYENGFNIHDSIHTDHVELIFSVGGWLGGAYQYWRFNVFYDCAVQFMGSFTRQTQPHHWVHNRNDLYADCIQNTTVSTSEQKVLPSTGIQLYPNPAHQQITLQTPTLGSYTILSVTGTVFQQGTVEKLSTTITIDTLPKGSYVLIFKGSEVQKTIQFLKY